MCSNRGEEVYNHEMTNNAETKEREASDAPKHAIECLKIGRQTWNRQCCALGCQSGSFIQERIIC